ncbi:MAG: hypothetical protein FJ318_04190 [SAR202 cluster bacterium]|nr:hypothetical protein [SAR202 cluster bacterium]
MPTPGAGAPQPGITSTSTRVPGVTATPTTSIPTVTPRATATPIVVVTPSPTVPRATATPGGIVPTATPSACPPGGIPVGPGGLPLFPQATVTPSPTLLPGVTPSPTTPPGATATPIGTVTPGATPGATPTPAGGLAVLTPIDCARVTLSVIPVSGIASLGDNVLVNGVSVVVGPDGAWATAVKLEQGQNVIQVRSTSPTGALSTRAITVFYNYQP